MADQDKIQGDGSPEDLNAVRRARQEKLHRLIEMGVNPYPHVFHRTHLAAEIKNHFDDFENQEVAIAGRLMAIRRMGKASFAHLEDSSGRIQIYLRLDFVGEKNYEIFKLSDSGDLVGVKGSVVRTRTGEITIKVVEYTLLSKTLRPIPVVKEKIEDGKRIIFDAFADKEMRYRQRYVDLIVNPQVREVFVKRARIINSVREYLNQRGFLEVETPILQPLYGGATARPFTTHHNALNMTLYLRIADELYLKRLIVGGFDAVYEFGKDFRNEGMDRFHNPEFTMLELYVAYEDYYFMMDLVEEMFSKIARDLYDSYEFTYQGQKIDLTPPWPRVPMFEAIEKETGYQLFEKNLKELREIADALHISWDETWGEGKIIDEIFSERVEPKLIQPTFIIDYPISLSPLAKKHREKPGLVERFEPFIAGREVGNAFTELNDPIDQRERFMAQLELKARGDEEAQPLDEDFLRALEYGMPPTTGLGVGIDRLIMLFTDQASIRDVLFFPQMRPEQYK
ncbi:MAG: lysine--tRNA ligase [Calditrichaeota bacterium]|nr:MAG: lysine--tRNA ligase [Calditrichota bacterium]